MAGTTCLTKDIYVGANLTTYMKVFDQDLQCLYISIVHTVFGLKTFPFHNIPEISKMNLHLTLLHSEWPKLQRPKCMQFWLFLSAIG